MTFHLFDDTRLTVVQLDMFIRLRKEFSGRVDFLFETLSENHSGALPYLQSWSIIRDFIERDKDSLFY